MSKTKGFTLIELLVVISIIALLSAIGAASLNSTRKKARDTRRRADLKAIQTALDLYYDTNNAYPLPAGGSGVWSGNCGNYGNYTTYIQGLVPTYMTTLPFDPKPVAGNCYIYISNSTDYQLLAYNTMETPGCPPMPAGDSMWVSRSATQCTIGVYTPGASAW